MSNILKYKFSGHQTFTFRYGWLEKGVHGIETEPDLFFRDDALVKLGVGKNMVSSIKHWCQISQLVEVDTTIKGNTGRYMRVSSVARKLLIDDPWDPFLEDDASLWLIHWLITTNPSIGTSWQILFSNFHRPDFTKKELVDYILSFAEKKDIKIKESVISRDVDCLIRTYVPSHTGTNNSFMEESFNCPLMQLNLLQPSPDGDLYRFSIGPKTSFPKSVFAYALHEHFGRLHTDQNTMSIQECLYGIASPGQVFKLDENSLIEIIEDLEEVLGDNLILDETSGLKQIYRRKLFDPISLLDNHYRGNSR